MMRRSVFLSNLIGRTEDQKPFHSIKYFATNAPKFSTYSEIEKIVLIESCAVFKKRSTSKNMDGYYDPLVLNKKGTCFGMNFIKRNSE